MPSNRFLRTSVTLAAVALATLGFSPSPHEPVIHYTLRIDAANLSAFSVEMRVRNAPDTFRIAMNAHPEYDDKFWRFLNDMRVDSKKPGASVARADSAVWRVSLPGGEGVIRYRIVLPRPEPGPRSAWKPFLSATGGLVGGPQSFLYMIGYTSSSSHVTLDIPADWSVASGLTPTSEPRTLHAATVADLVEGPIFVGRYSTWRFDVDGTPHRIIYWRAQGAAAFDTTEFVRGVRGIVEQSVAVFGRAPWREYTFVFQDSAWGGLEHPNSVTLGAPSADLARNPQAYLRETAHEFFHSWNLMRIRPAEYRTVDWKVQQPTSGLWFSEGLTIFYADLLRRRAGMPTENDTTRAAHLGSIISRYYNQAGNARISAERVSRTAYNAEPDALGDYSASTHLQGEVIGAMLDFIIRAGSDGRRNVDDLMRLMHARYSGERGFLGPDIERAVESVCACDVTPFFDAHVRNGTPIDFNRILAPLGLRTSVSQAPAVGRDGTPMIDLGVWAWVRASDNTLRLRVSNPENVWGRAGLRTGDRLFAVNGLPVSTWLEFRGPLGAFRAGDTLRLDVERAGKRTTVAVVGTQLVQSVVRIEPIVGAPERAVRLRTAWAAGR